MASDEEKYNRRMALEQICAVDQYGVLEGVEFDLRHELLDPSEWRTEARFGREWAEYRVRRSPDLPFIWFPWYGKFNQDELLQEAEKSFPQFHGLSKAEIAKYKTRFLRDFTPECLVNLGDKIVVYDVTRDSNDDEFSHPHDSEIRYAWCKIKRASGKSTRIVTPITYCGATSVTTVDRESKQFDRITHRIAKHFGVNTIYDLDVKTLFDLKRNKGKLATFAACSAQGVLNYSLEALKLLRTLDHESPDYAKAKNHWESVNFAVLTGYYWARAEAELAMKPLAVSALRVKAGARSGGAKSGKERRRKRAETWEPIAKEEAKKLRAKNPSASQDDVATEIASGWKYEDPRAPGHVTLKGLISRMEKAGELPKRQRI